MSGVDFLAVLSYVFQGFPAVRGAGKTPSRQRIKNDNAIIRSMMRYTETTNISDPRFLTLYNSAFPPEERIPPALLARTFGHGGRLRYYFDSDAFVGFSLTYDHDGVRFITYIAVVPELRGEGYGSDILDSIASDGTPRGMFLTAETVEGKGEEMKQRNDRRRFYRRNGWKPTGFIIPGKVTREVYQLDHELAPPEIVRCRESFYFALDGQYRRIRASGPSAVRGRSP